VTAAVWAITVPLVLSSLLTPLDEAPDEVGQADPEAGPLLLRAERLALPGSGLPTADQEGHLHRRAARDGRVRVVVPAVSAVLVRLGGGP
jgi:hypothetical protein